MILLGVVFGVVLEFDDDLGAAFLVGDLFDGVRSRAITGPDIGRLVGAEGLGVDLDGLGYHEGGVETDAELADEIIILGATFFDGIEEGFGAGVGDGAEELDQFFGVHADTVILNGQGLGLFVGRDVDLECEVAIGDVLLGKLRVTQLLEGVRCVGDQLANEDLFLSIKGVNNDIEQLLDFGLELVGFRHDGCFRFSNYVLD